MTSEHRARIAATALLIENGVPPESAVPKGDQLLSAILGIDSRFLRSEITLDYRNRLICSEAGWLCNRPDWIS